MISVLARQLERYRDQIQVWMEQRLAAKAVVARSEKELQKKQQKLQQLAEEREKMVEMYKQKLSGLYRGMSREHTKQQEANAKLKQEVAAAHNAEQDNGSYIEQLETRYAALRQTLEKTLTKLDEVKTSYNELQVESADYTAIHARYVEQAPELTRALNRIQTLAGEKEAIQQQTQETRGDLLRAQDELNRERAHALRLEHFIRKIAVGAPGARNHGGSPGYILDTKSKKEATGLLKEASKLRTAAEASGYTGARDPLLVA
jgi:chromosome segregation ATPase